MDNQSVESYPSMFTKSSSTSRAVKEAVQAAISVAYNRLNYAGICMGQKGCFTNRSRGCVPFDRPRWEVSAPCCRDAPEGSKIAGRPGGSQINSSPLYSTGLTDKKIVSTNGLVGAVADREEANPGSNGYRGLTGAQRGQLPLPG